MAMMSAVVPSGSSLNSSSSPGLLEQQESDRQRLLSALLNAVKACQTRFGGRSQLATESEPCVAALCASLEAVLWHGLRPKPASAHNSTLRQVTELVSTSLSFNRVLPQDIPAPWRFIRETLTRHEAERFLLLHRVCTDWGRGRAWLRACLNERSLERGLSSLRAAPSLSTHYHTWAFLRDEERASTLTTMAAGLGSVLFAINVDSADFNEGDPGLFGDHAESLLGKSEPIIATSNSEISDGQVSKPQQLRRRRAPPHIVSFDDDSLRYSPGPSTPLRPEELPSSSAPPTCLNSPVSPQPPVQNLLQSPATDGDQGATLTPVSNLAVGELIPVFPGSCVAMTTTDEEDSLSVPSYSEDTDCAAAALLATQQLLDRQSAQLLTPASPDKQPGTFPQTPLIATEDPVMALRTLLSQCTTLETENRSLKASLRHEQAACSALLEELSEARQSHEGTLTQLQARSQALSRENELLKHQLRKYVAAVQMLNKDGASAHQTLAGLAPALNQMVNEKRAQEENEASQYEHKLVQVAEMHGELMEFNERLQRALFASETAAAQLRSELELLRGPLPSSRSSPPADPLLEPDSPTSVQSGALVHVWVPSAFLTGGTTDVHHVYQVYVRIRNDEWNVYRRYAQFHSLHRELKRKHPAVRTFDFPPKKTLGNKDARFVEERRLRLQKYLRLVVNHIVQGGIQPGESPHREMLTKLLPFFGESVASGESSRHPSRSSSATRSPLPRASIPHYTGL